MRLYEEYLNRHKISIPIIHHANNSSLLLKVESSRWIFLTIKWIEGSRHPGIYDIGIKLPIHNGFEKHIFNAWYSVSKKWDEYEEFLDTWSNSLKKVEIIENSNYLVLDFFEMFVYIFDSWFQKRSFTLKKNLFDILDKENSLEKRFFAFQDMIIYLSTNHIDVFKVWKHEIFDYLPYYADWLGTLVNNKCKKNIQQ